MIRTELQFHTPESLDEAAELLGAEAAAVLGGGTLLVPLMSRGERSHTHLIELRRLGLDAITREGDELVVGARASYTAVAASAECRETAPLLAEVAAGVTGGAQVRNRGTFAGSACYANPSSDAPAVLVALEARLRVHGRDGSREVPAAEFFRDAFITALAPGEFVTHIVVPPQSGPYAYEKVKLCEGSWPIITAAATTTAGGGRQVTLGGVCTTPVRVRDVAGTDGLEARVTDALGEPWGDELAPGSYRTAVAAGLAGRVVTRQMGGEPA